MAIPTIETPPVKEDTPPRPSPQSQHYDEQEFHLLIEELRDDNSRSRLREALWISIIFHLVVLFTAKELPRFLPKRGITLLQSEEMLKKRDLTYIEQPPDKQILKEKPQTD